MTGDENPLRKHLDRNSGEVSKNRLYLTTAQARCRRGAQRRKTWSWTDQGEAGRGKQSGRCVDLEQEKSRVRKE